MGPHSAKRGRSRGIALGVILLAPMLAGCATNGTYPDAPNSGGAAVSVVGTPFLLAFKIPVCAVTLAMGPPLAGLAEVANSSRIHPWDVQRGVDQAVAQNCGPPWILPSDE